MDNKKNNDALENMDEFNEKYGHYVSEDEETQIIPVPHFERNEVSESYDYEETDNVQEYDDNSELTDDSTDVKAKAPGNFFTRNKYKNTKIIALCLVIAL
ncbi:MAG TPA: hypothetical protein DCY31_06485, partial [Ruminococcaceae bacterium]|nr:hypothetical protein [Oscillospiraceae bacterium]